MNDNLLQPITQDLARHQAPRLFREQLTFRADSGYDLGTIFLRAKAVLERAFRQGPRTESHVGLFLEDLPPFNPGNRLRVTVEVLGPEDADTKAQEPVETQAVTGKAGTDKG